MHVLNLVLFFLWMKFACVGGKQKIKKKKRTKQITSRAQDENDPITDNVAIA